MKKSLAKTFILTSAVLAQPGIVVSAYGQEEKQVEEVVVTGSRILRNPLDEAAPMTNLSVEDLEKTGLTNFGDILQQLPVTGSAINSRFNVPGNSGFPQDGTGIGAGASEVSLRNLGAKRTLVLVDGRRWIPGASASGVPVAVDLNTIPANVIQRVEVLQDGASAIYGSDAIGGVVNVITNRSFEGFKLDAQASGYDEGDGESYNISALWGVGNDETHIVFSASRVDERGIQTADRAQSAFPSPFATSCEAGGCSSFTPQGRFILGPNLGGADITLNDGVLNDGMGNIPNFDPSNPASGDFHAFTAADRFNFNGPGFNFLRTPNERYNLFTSVSHKFNDDLEFIAKASYTNRNSATQGAPEPLCLGNGCGNAILDNIVIDADQIYNPFGVDLSVANGNLDFFGRRPLESGPRMFEQNVDTYFFSGGFEGKFEIGDRNYYWDFTTSYGNNRGVQQKAGSHNAARLAVALADPAVCAAVPNCVPFNFFGGQGPDGTGSITQEMLDFVGFVQRDISDQTLLDISGNLTGAIAELPAGTLAFATGFEYREHEGSFQPDPVAESGETAGIASGATSGEFDVTEFYAEINIPLLANVAGADYLELNSALRNSDYSSFGSETTFKVSSLWRPISDLSLRASVSTGIRAPGIGELFGGAAREDFTFLDPCADVLGNLGTANGGRDSAQPQNIIDNCAALGIPTTFAQTNPQLSARSTGNDELIAETSDSQSFGLVYSPSWTDDVSWAESITFSLDYYNVEVEDAIQGLFAGDIIDNCVSGASLDNTFCNLVQRSPSGSVNIVENRLQNIGGIEASGYDIAVRYSGPTTDIGQFSWNVNATNLDEYTETTPTNPSGTDLAGTITDETFQRAFPEWRMTSTLDWQYETFGAGITFRYVSDMDQPSGNVLSSEVFTDIQFRYKPAIFEDKFSITFGANNVLDNDPAVCDACGSIGMSPVIHDLPGVVAYLRLSAQLD